MRTRLFSLAVVLIALLCLASPAFAQGERGAITGLITDAAGAVVPNVEVTATHLQTNSVFKAVSTSVGVYRIPYLPAGSYRVNAALKGFKNAVAEPVVVTIAAVVTTNLKLELGSSTETITVSAEITRLESSSSELGYSVSSADFHEWPVSSNDDGQRQIQSFIFNSLPGTSGDSYSGSINGAPNMSHEVYIEGISIGRADIAGDTAEFTPSVDAVSEFRLQTGGLSAAYGGGLTAVANFNIKSGTNQLHGTAYDYVMNSVFNAAGFDNNAYGTPKAPFKQNSFGVAAGGPLLVPKVYNGTNRSFWFFSYEGDRRRTGTISGYRTLPTSAFKQGDFSVVPQAIFDPHSTVKLADGTYSRTAFPGNKIPPSAISKVSQNILTLAPIPDPTLPGILRNMLGTNNSPIFNLNTFAGKFDQTITDRHKLAFYINSNERVRYNGNGKGYQPVPGSASGPFALQDIHGTMVRVGWDWTITPRLLNHLGAGYNRLNNANSSLSLGGDWPSKIGLGGVAETTFPQILWSGTTAQGGSLTGLGRSNASIEPNGSTILANDTTWIHGGHSIRWGTEIRKYFYDQDYRGNTSGVFTFGPAQTADPRNAGTTGYSFASFMSGSVTKSSLTIASVNPQSRIWTPAFYVADDWKVSRRLTLNLGLRWDIVGGVYEVNGYSSGLGPDTANPGASGYPGALVFLSDLKRKSFQDTFYGELGPRLGFAYAVNDRLVVRGGYGLMYTPPIANVWGFATIDGYSGYNNFATSNREPVFYWDNGYPAYKHTLPNKDPELDNGSTISYAPRDSARQPYTQNYTIGLQYLLNKDTTITANYVGNKGFRLNAGNFANMNQLHPKYLSLGDTLLDDISQHPEIKLPYAGFEGSVAQALLPYPQYSGGGVTYQFPHSGRSDYNALQVVASRRLTKGLGFLVSYAFQKALTTTDSAQWYYGGTSQDVYNRALEKSVASFDHTQQLRLTWIFELPVGKGRPLLNRGGVLNQVIGGWTITANQQYQSGNPLSIGTSLDTSGYLFNGTIRADVISGQPLTVSSSGRLDVASGTGLQVLNPKAFAEPPTTPNGVVTHLGTSPRYFGNLRGRYQPSENFGIFKRFPFGEGKHIEFRADMFNAFNRSGLGDPVTTVGDPQFGQIIDVASGPREIQLALRITF
jgi:Carboxypeptidase regulatory-like domain